MGPSASYCIKNYLGSILNGGNRCRGYIRNRHQKIYQESQSNSNTASYMECEKSMITHLSIATRMLVAARMKGLQV